jgi:plastocyanin
MVPPAAPAPTAADKYQVVLYEYKFHPAKLVVPVGTKVTWLNRDLETHNVTGVAASDPFDSGKLPNQATFSHTFTAAGEFLYLCIPHPGMQGTIVVE